jgi:hypothetical protein
MSDRVEERFVPFHVDVQSWWRASIVSPFTGKEVVAFGETIEEAKRKAELLIWGEATARGFEARHPAPPADATEDA